MRGLPGPPSASPATNHKKAGGKRLKKKRSGASLLDLSKMENAMPAAMTALNLVKMAMYLSGKNGVIADGSTDGQSLGNYLGTLSTQSKIRFVMVNPVSAKAKLKESYYDSKSLDYIQKMTNLDFYLCSTSDSTNKKTAQHMRLECVPQPRIVYTSVTDRDKVRAAAFFDLGDVSQDPLKTTYAHIKEHIKNHTTKALIAQLVLKDSLAATTTELSYKAYIIKAINWDIPQFDAAYAKPTQTTALKHYFGQHNDNAENPEFYNKFIFDDLLEISKYKLSLFVEKSSTHDRLLKYKFTDA